MTARLGAVLPLVLVLAMPVAAAAQQRDTTFKPVPAGTTWTDNIPPSTEEMKPEEQAGTSGFFLGIVSMLGGAAAGSLVGASDCPPKAEDNDCIGRRATTGALIAGTVMVPVGVHIAAHNRGDLLKSLGVSVLLGSAFYAGFHAIPGSPTALAPFLAMPLQVITSVKLSKVQSE